MIGASAAVRGDIYSPDLPWTTREPERLGQVIMNHVLEHEPYFRTWAQTWFENFQFLYGNHNVRWSRKHGFAVDYDTLAAARNSISMRAQTNIARVVVEGLASLIYSNLPKWQVDAVDESSLRGKRFRKIYQKLLDAYMSRLCMDKEFQAAAVAYVLFGQVAWRVDWNFGAGQLLEIPQFRKVRVPQFSTYMAPNQWIPGGLLETPTPIVDSTGQPITEDQWQPILDEMGRQIINKVSAGDVFCNVKTPLEYQREVGSAGPHKARWWREFRVIDYDQFLDEYKDVPGATKAFKNIRPIYYNQELYSFAVRHWMRMQFTTPPSMDEAPGRQAQGFKASMFKYKVLVVEHFDRPHRDKWPEGRRVVVCNGEATHVTKPSYNVPGKMDGWHPYAEAQWLVAAPSSIAAGPMNDVTRKNRELNVKDSLQATAIRRNMGSQLLVKNGMGLDPNSLTGEPGVAHAVSDVYGARWLHDEMPIPPVMAQLRQQDKDDVYEVSGAGDALRGAGSRDSSSSGYQQKIREEQEEKRLAPARKNWEGAVATVGEKIASCLKANVIRLDEQVIGFLKGAGAGEFTIQDVVAFLKTPVTFGVDIRVEKDSMALKSKATHMALLQELAQGPLGQRLAQDAKVLDKYLQYFGAETYRDASAVHRDRAERENEVFLDVLRLGPDIEGVKKPVVLFEDDDQIHLAEHQEFAVRYADELMSNEWLMLQFLEHQERHRLQDQEKQALLAPGSSLQTGTMLMGARQQAAPTVQMVGQQAMIRQQQQAQQKQQQPPSGGGQAGGGGPAATGQRQAPQAPKLPGGKTDPGAPSGATPPAKAGGTRA